MVTSKKSKAPTSKLRITEVNLWEGWSDMCTGDADQFRGIKKVNGNLPPNELEDGGCYLVIGKGAAMIARFLKSEDKWASINGRRRSVGGSRSVIPLDMTGGLPVS